MPVADFYSPLLVYAGSTLSIYLLLCKVIVNYKNDNSTLVKGLEYMRRNGRLLMQTGNRPRLSRQDSARMSRREAEDMLTEEK